MIIDKLKLSNFRNYINQEIEFSPEVNIISGYNGSGKTNILEAISVISNLRSFRQASDVAMTCWKSDFYYCRGEISGTDYSLFEVGFYRDREQSKKKIKIDGAEIKKVSDYYGNMITVAFIPSDINIPGGAPDLRRRYFDSVISKLFPDYINDLNRFRDILNSRNVLLKKIRERSSDQKQLDVWDMLLAEKASLIIKRRNEFIRQFSVIFNSSYNRISGESNPPLLKYRPSLSESGTDEIYRIFKSELKSDIRKGSTGTGPQRDDYIFVNDENLNFFSYASQGQRRTAAISLKIAEYEIIRSLRNKKSIILIDDIFSELDEKRRSNMIDLLMKEGQLIFTMVDKGSLHLDNRFVTRTFNVNNGIVS